MSMLRAQRTNIEDDDDDDDDNHPAANIVGDSDLIRGVQTCIYIPIVQEIKSKIAISHTPRADNGTYYVTITVAVARTVAADRDHDHDLGSPVP